MEAARIDCCGEKEVEGMELRLSPASYGGGASGVDLGEWPAADISAVDCFDSDLPLRMLALIGLARAASTKACGNGSKASRKFHTSFP
mmetsp:Transcript_9524/g.29454  ORF Transcript_9524/g.29454 Transcript_9524/m.29454 type:complete len:88 (+) Transcript_9524:1198-1461(+)